MARKLTIRDIARLAGVSKSTVSRVLNTKQDVDPATRERVLRVIEEQTFVLDMSAAKLAGGRSRLIGSLVPSLAWPLMSEIMRGISDVVAQSPYELLLYSITKNQVHEEQQQVISRILHSNLASGLLAVFPGPATPYLTELYEKGFPVVIIDDRGEPTSVPWVSADNRVGAYAATRYLLQMGHRRIAYIQGPVEYRASQARYQGYCDALQEAGLAIDPTLIQQGDFTPTSGCAPAEIFLSMADRPTAIFAGNDQMAYDVLTVAHKHGLRIPRDLSLVGFDDIPPSAYLSPPLTTVQQPFYQMGKQAAELLLSLLDVSSSSALNTLSKSLSIRLVTDLVVRDSCSPPRTVKGY
ncbi:LacI family transcriptional regulator [Ktedonosporobacter rubrisoli]|uniref:LacI family transcriptional regulator n=1 Tax=Ktedonosporobacter rubrisoli TaxID=2509675 RepID=A0A4P6JI92_KTERU|nr:LacI family DNA-binding transcriptional regulator [Ktedonosporobacter rubrisoli]QBD74600.1 LacI family transcriptional regulator [Ktedonosporobacter rubrisoli]